MSEMVERVARAIWLKSTMKGWDDGSGEEKRMCQHCGLLRSAKEFEPEARAAIEAMREPTREMLDGARDWSIKRYGRGVGNDAASACYGAMIDAAINEGK